MKHSTDRILVTHVGSLIRPPELIAFLEARRDERPVDERAFAACLDASVAAIVRRQHEAGIDILSDGEFGKSISWSRYVLERLSGFEHRSDPRDRSFATATSGEDRREFAEFYAEYDPSQGFSGMTGWAVTGPITYRGGAAIARDIARLKAALAGVPAAEAFMPAVAPGSVVPDRIDEYYRSDEDYLAALADALHEEYRAIVDAGFILQIDDAYLASTYDLIVPPGTLADYHRWAALRVEALNRALAGIPEDRVRYHVCWGSWNGPHVHDVAVKDIVDLLFRMRVGAYSIEMANPRHEHEWRVWEEVKLPPGRLLLPGLVTHATNIVEHPELVAERITRVARLVGRENVIAGTDCGFAQGPFARRVHPSIMWAKLQSLAAGARLASRELWR